MESPTKRFPEGYLHHGNWINQGLTKAFTQKELRPMFADPQTVTVSGVGKTLNRTASTETGGSFATSDRAYKLKVLHSYGRRERHTFRLQFDSLVANPLVSGQNINQSMTVSVTVDVPPGYDTAAAKAVVDGVLANLTASTGANVTKLIGGEG